MRPIHLLTVTSFLLFVANCQDSTPSKLNPPHSMTNETLQEMITAIDPSVSGEPGFWNFQVEGLEIMCITDENADRMRIMTQITEISKISEAQLSMCMVANFDRALDARYCISDGYLWGAFIHPLSDLSPELFISAVQQVYTVRATFGTKYTSGALIFRGLEEDSEK